MISTDAEPITRNALRGAPFASWLAVALAISLAAPATVHLTLTIASGLLLTSSSISLEAEVVDRIVWLSSMGTALLLITLAYFAKSHSIKLSPLTRQRIVQLSVLVAGTLLLLSLSWIQVLPGMDSNGAWWGFGDYVALAAIAITVIIFAIGPVQFMRRTRAFSGLLSLAVVAVWYLPVAVQPPWGVLDLFHSRYVVNEVLGPLSGHFSLGDFAANYTHVLGLPLLALSPLASRFESFPFYGIAISWLSLLALVTLVLLVLAAAMALPKRLKIFAPILTLPIILISQPEPSGYVGAITSGFSGYPGRILGFAIVLVVLLRRVQRGAGKWDLFLGLSAGTAATNNFEFGATGLAVTVLVLLMSRIMTLRSWLIFGVGVLVPPTLYGALVLLTSGQIAAPNYTVFALGFGDGFGSIPMPVIGTWTLVLGILTLGAAMGAWLLLTGRTNLFVPAALGAYAGLAGLIQFAYYANRSSTYGQLQLLLAHVALVVVAVIAVVTVTNGWRRRTPESGLVLLVCVLPLAAMVSVRPPIEEWSRISPLGKGPTPLTIDSELEKVATAVRQAQEDFPGEAVGVVAEAGNYLELTTGARNLLPTNSPFDLAIVPSLEPATCEAVSTFEGIIIHHPLASRLPSPFCGLEVEPYKNDTLISGSTRG